VHRLFLDANVLFSAAYREDAGVGRLWTVPGVELLTSDYAVEEARRNLLEPPRRERLSRLLEPIAVRPTVSLDPKARAGVELREKDWPILGGAVLAGATHLITGDLRDFGPYLGSVVLGVRVVTPAQYLRGV
jgi:predicted nucleic acid-binding protein